MIRKRTPTRRPSYPKLPIPLRPKTPKRRAAPKRKSTARPGAKKK